LDRQIPPNLWAGFLLGAGRRKAADAIDFAVGISAIKKIGEHAERIEPLMIVHARNQTSLSSVLPFLDRAVAIE
jgi:thymidine phosphorylase